MCVCVCVCVCVCMGLYIQKIYCVMDTYRPAWDRPSHVTPYPLPPSNKTQAKKRKHDPNTPHTKERVGIAKSVAKPIFKNWKKNGNARHKRQPRKGKTKNPRNIKEAPAKREQRNSAQKGKNKPTPYEMWPQHTKVNNKLN